MKENINTVHEGHKNHKCEYNGKSFTGVQSLKWQTHTIHEGQKDSKCEPTKSYLKEHILRVHESQNDYICETCSKSFSRAGSLKRHDHTIHKGHK